MLLPLLGLLAQAVPASPAVATRPRLLKRPEPVNVAEARRLGHNGDVVLKGEVGVDGRLTKLVVATSSLSPLLDAAALKAAEQAQFEPAKDAGGQPVPFTMSFGFTYEGDDVQQTGWLGRYRCAQARKDVDWWLSVHKDKKLADYRLHQIIGGARVVSNPGGLMEGLKEGGAGADWEAAMTRCAATPDALFIDQLPTREFLKRLLDRGQL